MKIRESERRLKYGVMERERERESDKEKISGDRPTERQIRKMQENKMK